MKKGLVRKKFIKRKVSFKKNSFKFKINSKIFSKKVLLIVVSILILILGIFLIAKYGVTVGKTPGVIEVLDVNIPDVDIPDCNEDNEGTEVDQYICSDNQWHKCDEESIKDNKYLCSDEEWDVCDDNNEDTKINQYICSNNQWHKCDEDEGIVWSYILPDEIEEKNAGTPRRVGCCGDDQCNSQGVCYDRGLSFLNSKNFLCGDDNDWELCGNYSGLTGHSMGVIKNNYICNDNNEWIICEEGNEMGQYICSDEQWSVCDEENEGNEVDQYICSNDQWKECNEDLKDELSENGDYWCEKDDEIYSWSSDFTIPQKFYEVVVEKDKPPKNIGDKTNIKTIELCDAGTENVASKATLCYDDPKIYVDSVSELASGNNKPPTDDNLLYIYEEEVSPKKVSIIYLLSLASKIYLPLSEVSKNLINERRLALNLSEEYYLVSHPTDQLFSLASLKLTHIPTLQEFLPVSIPGNKIQFTVFANKAIVFDSVRDRLTITSAIPQEAAAAYVTPYNLEEDYEVRFSLTNPVNIIDIEKTITVCGNDNPNDPQVLLICIDNQQFTSLNKDILTRAAINGQDVALLYQLVGSEKQASIFFLEELERSGIDLTYNYFVDNLVGGRRIALSFEGGLYLLSQEEGLLSLPAASLTSYKGDNAPSFQAMGSEKKVEFLIPEGRVILSRDLVYPPPPFNVSALNIDEILDSSVDLTKDLFSTMSSQVPVNIEPDLGIVRKSNDDTTKNKDLFKINSDLVGEQILSFKTPQVIGNTLLYYFDAAVDGSNYIKMVKVYHLYDLSNEQEHNFDDQFLDVFTAGNELALQFDNSYYLLGYAGGSGFFSIQDLTLKTLEGELQDLERTTYRTATFVVPEGKIQVTIDDPNNKIYFESLSSEIFQTDTLTEDNYSITLTTGNRVKINTDTFKICPTSFTMTKPDVVALCVNNDDPRAYYAGDTKIFNNGKNLLWFKGTIAGKKQISIYNLINVNRMSFDWGVFSEKISQGKSKAFNWNDQQFIIDAADPFILGTYKFVSVPEGEGYPIQNPRTSSRSLENGTFVYKDNLLFVDQNLDENLEAQLNFYPFDHKIITEEGLETDVYSGTISFVTNVNGEVYKIYLSTYNSNLIKVDIRNSNGYTNYFGFMPENAIKNVLLSDGSLITLQALENNKINVTQ